MTAGRDELTLEADRLAGAQHIAVELDPAVRLARHHLADLLADDIGNAGVVSVGGVCLDMDIIGQGTVRPVEEFDDAKALVDGVEEGAVALLAVGQRRLSFLPPGGAGGYGGLKPRVLDLQHQDSIL